MCASKFDTFPKTIRAISNKIIPISIIKPYIEKNLIFSPEVSLIYSSGHIIFNKKYPWVVDLEFVTHFSGYDIKSFLRYKKYIQECLESENCKRILPWTKAGSRTVELSFSSDKIYDKIQTVYLSVPPKKFIKNHNSDIIRLLFVGSQNFPKDFEIKGGKEVFEAFKILRKKYDNIQLLVRSFVPIMIKEKYKKCPNIIIIDYTVSGETLDLLFKSADIFVFPSHNTPGLVILDAMSYELPIVTTNVWGNSEMVTDSVNGFLVEKSVEIDYYSDNFIPKWGSGEFLNKLKKDLDSKVVDEIVKKTGILIDDEKLRRRMGKAGRHDIEQGKFSITNRNIKLKRIFDEAIGQ